MPNVKKLFRSTAGTGTGIPSRMHRNAKRAFSILEVMVAASVMALTISSSLIVIQHGLRALDTARCSTLAGQILQSQMEKLRLLNWFQFTHTTYGPVNFTTFPAEVSTSPTAETKRFFVGNATSTCAQLIETLTGTAFDTTMKKITLTATWKGIDGRTHSLSYISYYGKNGLSDFFYTTH